MKYIEYFEKYLIYFVVFFLALFVLPLLPGSFVLPREILLTFSVILLLVLWSVKLVLKGSMSFSGGKFDFPVFLISLSYLLSAIFISPNKMDAFWFPGTATFVVASAFLYFFINQLKKEEKGNVAISLFFSAVVFSLLVLFSTLGIFSKIPQLPAFLKVNMFNTLGGAIPGIIFLASVLPLALNLILKNKDIAKRLFYSVSSIIVAFGLLISVKNSIPAAGGNTGLLGYNTSWQILVDSLKFNPVLGVGPGNYVTAFNRFKPLSFNSSPFWTNSFTSSRNFYLTAVTEVGFAAALSLFVLLLAIYKYAVKGRLTVKEFKYDGATARTLSILVFLILAFIFPVAFFGITLLFILLSLNSDSEEKTFNVNFLAQGVDSASTVSSRIPSFIVALPVIALAVALSYFGSRYTLAEYRFKEAVDAVNNNDARLAVDKMVAAINLNPRVDRYRSSYSQVNLAIAQNVATKKDLTDNDKSAISQLIQVAIQEGKATVALNPTRSDTWSLLAGIYRSIMPFAQGGDEFAIQTYRQAIALDPVNPNLRISLGGIYYALGRYDEAIESFKLAVLTKPDLANAHYNLSAAYKGKKDIDKAIEEMKVVLTLVKIDTPDYDLAKGELENLELNRPSSVPLSGTTEGQGNLTPPQPAEQPVIKPPLELPEEATPPQD